MQQQYPSHRPSPAHNASHTSAPQPGYHPQWHAGIPQLPQGAQGIIHLAIPLFGGSSPSSLSGGFPSPNQTPWPAPAPVLPHTGGAHPQYAPPMPNPNQAETQQANAPPPGPPAAPRTYTSPLPVQAEQLRPAPTAPEARENPWPAQHVDPYAVRNIYSRTVDHTIPRPHLIQQTAPQANRIDLRKSPQTNYVLLPGSPFDVHIRNLRLICHDFPWPIFVEDNTGMPITWQKIRQAVYDALQVEMTDAEWELTPEEKKQEMRSYRRAARREAGVPRRIDWLGYNTSWGGLGPENIASPRELMPGRSPIYETRVIVLGDRRQYR